MTLILITIMLAATGTSRAEVRILTVPMDGNEHSGFSAMSILNLKIWRTMRGQTQDGNPVARAQLLWDTNNLSSPTHEAALERGKLVNRNAAIVVWGQVYVLKESAVVTSFVTLAEGSSFRRDSERYEIWKIQIDGKKKASVELGVPNRAYAFAPFVLDRDFVDKYHLPNMLKVYDRPTLGGNVIDTLGSWFRSEGADGDFVKVRTAENGKRGGWVYLPQITKDRVDVVDFVAGLIRIYRGDWQNAISSLEPLAKNSKLPMEIQIDALLHVMHAKAMLKRPTEGEIDLALSLDRYSSTVVKSVVMGALSKCASEVRQGALMIRACEREQLSDIEGLMTRYGSVFSDDDPWAQSVRNALKSIN
ncbi:hypothetical protein AB9F35_00075 [Rhizobium leguminosarum]|uniref:hypothetical protein n=1 Tax=Rhizobium leguminosarum TaxID=384 RepID=UPI003F9C5CA4